MHRTSSFPWAPSLNLQARNNVLESVWWGGGTYPKTLDKQKKKKTKTKTINNPHPPKNKKKYENPLRMGNNCTYQKSSIL